MRCILVTIVLVICSLMVKAQKNPAMEIAGKVAQRMTDTLALSDGQRLQVYDINIRLHEQKKAMRSQYAGNAQLTTKIQAVENTRDSLYRAILTQNQFILYKEKKRTLMNVQ